MTNKSQKLWINTGLGMNQTDCDIQSRMRPWLLRREESMKRQHGKSIQNAISPAPHGYLQMRKLFGPNKAFLCNFNLDFIKEPRWKIRCTGQAETSQYIENKLYRRPGSNPSLSARPTAAQPPPIGGGWFFVEGIGASSLAQADRNKKSRTECGLCCCWS